MNKNQKKTINRRYSVRLTKVLEITKHKPVFPTVITTLIFDFAKQMAIGDKMNQIETTNGKKEMHKALLTISSANDIDEDLFRDKLNLQVLERVIDYLTIVSWPLSPEDKSEFNMLKEYVQQQFVEGAPPMYLLILKKRFDMFPYTPERYVPEKWNR